MIFRKKVSSNPALTIGSDDGTLDPRVLAGWDQASNTALRHMKEGLLGEILNPLHLGLTHGRSLPDVTDPRPFATPPAPRRGPFGSTASLVRAGSDPELAKREKQASKLLGLFSFGKKKAAAAAAAAATPDLQAPQASPVKLAHITLTEVLEEIDGKLDKPGQWNEAHYKTPGIYRENGNVDQTDAYYKGVKTLPPSEWKLDFSDTKEISSMIKKLVIDFFRSAFSSQQQDAIRVAIRQVITGAPLNEASVAIPILNNLLQNFSTEARATFKLLLAHFRKIAAHEAVNHMSTSNISISILSPKLSDLFDPSELMSIMPKTHWIAEAFLVHADQLQWD